ncbi:cytochrome P450 [Dothidotthia symphoricarpi CBS 119687]|uniref:Cytochrome P450 n=1 Tax=Dothidotthia symphoricarpi CBS 119687 TaxID=1392245 RepID=A0A6A5ZZC6_9PLEO|nr:cytochrome P450 [Dothidotthia symphoricarpi CBS 119687]KAF2124375.1 cytochrome P450 [Dothidotthia symphoricarpi CBS 119687]
MSLSFYAFVASLLALAAYRLSKVGRRPVGYPPGPPTLPLIGNLHLMPKEKGHLQLQKWAEEYGPVYSLILGTKVMIVLSSDQAIKDLLDKRSGIYSSRPDMYLGRLVSGGLRVVLMEYGETWRMVRKIVHNSLSLTAARSYVPYQDLESRAMLVGLLEKPDLFIDHIRRYTNSLTTQMTFSFRTTSIDDPKLKQLYHGFEKFSEVIGTQTAALLDLYPLLRALPDIVLPLRRYAKKLHEKESELYIGHWLNVKKAIKNGTARPCLCFDLARAQDEEGFSDALAGYVSGSMLEAGSDTTAATLIGFFQAMVLFPEAAKAAQEELDRVCGDRFPTLDDEPNLPYIRACVKESMRWMPTAILGIPHAVIRDDEYMGYKIPKGAGIMWNVWAIHNDPKRHPDPRRFDPARYIDDRQTAAEAANNPIAAKRDQFVFGAGRRLCQGMHIAERSLFLAIARLLWAFDFHKARDADGNEMIPDASELTEGILVQPKPFPARIVPRNSDKAASVESEWGKMSDLLDEDLQWKVLPEGLLWKGYSQTPKAP